MGYGGTLIFDSVSKPHHRRLYMAMAISSCVIILLLAALGRFFSLINNARGPGISQQEIDVFITPERSEPEPVTAAPPVEQLEEPEVQPEEIPVVQEVEVPPESPEKPTENESPIDWQASITEAAAAVSNERMQSQDARAELFRQNYSMMFQPAETWAVSEKDPVVDEFRFKPEIHVGGIGVTIGSCFIGLPLVGVPVEDRQVAITLWVCAKDSG